MNQQWAEYQHERVTAGLCISCDTPAVLGNLRCENHIKINRERSKAWREAHPTARKDLKMAWRAKGLCDMCPQHRPLVGAQEHCAVCLLRFRRNSQKAAA
jgi:hypothetical protein